jgi:hypothetical protein
MSDTLVNRLRGIYEVGHRAFPGFVSPIQLEAADEIERLNLGHALLMMFIKDSFSASGKVSKNTARAMMSYVYRDGELQELVNNSDGEAILRHKVSERTINDR